MDNEDQDITIGEEAGWTKPSTVKLIRRWISDNKQVIIVGATCLIVGATLAVIATKSKQPVLINHLEPVFAPVFNNDNSSNVIASFGGHQHKIVKCLETGEIWEKAKDAAEAMGVTESLMSRHLNGHKDHVSDLHFVILGLGAAA